MIRLREEALRLFSEKDCAGTSVSGVFNNPILIWGRYCRSLFRCKLTVPFRFHHTRTDGANAGEFLAELQRMTAKLR